MRVRPSTNIILLHAPLLISFPLVPSSFFFQHTHLSFFIRSAQFSFSVFSAAPRCLSSISFFFNLLRCFFQSENIKHIIQSLHFSFHFSTLFQQLSVFNLLNLNFLALLFTCSSFFNLLYPNHFIVIPNSSRLTSLSGRIIFILCLFGRSVSRKHLHTLSTIFQTIQSLLGPVSTRFI